MFKSGLGRSGEGGSLSVYCFILVLKICISSQNSKEINCLKNSQVEEKKSCIWETKNLSTDADSRTDTILERLRDL